MQVLPTFQIAFLRYERGRHLRQLRQRVIHCREFDPEPASQVLHLALG